MKQERIDALKKLAARTTWDDDAEDFNPYDNSGGNLDDAYFGGQEDGKTHLAREILNELGITWEE